jgi:hypothetical protein
MQRIYYTNDTLVTGTEIARALLEYAAALARSDSAQTVSIPVRRPDGTSARATLLVGPASQLIAEDVQDDEDLGEELRDDVLVARIKAMTAELAAPRAISTRAAATAPDEVANDADEQSIEWL